jgi:hypothetical protein
MLHATLRSGVAGDRAGEADRQRGDEGGERRVRIRVPADVDIADRIFAGLTARQLAIFGADGLVLLALYAVLGERLPLALLGVLAVPPCLLGLLWATTSLEGTTWEQLAFAALRHSRSLGADARP